MAVLSDAAATAASDAAPFDSVTAAAGAAGTIKQISRTCLEMDIMGRQELHHVRNLLTSVEQLCCRDCGSAAGPHDSGGDVAHVFQAVQYLCRMAGEMVKQVESRFR